MIRLQRDRTAGAIPKIFRGTGRIEKLLLLLAGRRAGAPDFDAKVWKTAKNQLKKESCGKCAYCEASTAVVAHGDVEHFRPKDLYWWLAYCYDNYLYSCQICNEQYKSNHFPVSGTRLSEPPLPEEALSGDALRAAVRQELKRVRWPIYRDLAIFRGALEGGRVDQALRREIADTVRAMMAPDAQFSGMVRYFVQVEWNLSLD